MSTFRTTRVYVDVPHTTDATPADIRWAIERGLQDGDFETRLRRVCPGVRTGRIEVKLQGRVEAAVRGILSRDS